MARTNSVNFTGPLQYPIADNATDLFKKEDVQVATKALDLHDHTAGKGLVLPAGAIPNGTITSAHIADGTIVGGDIANGTINGASTGTSKFTPGSINNADIQPAGVGNSRLGPDAPRRNLLTNGSFNVWQRGNGPFTVNGAYCADKWYILVGNGSSCSVSAIGSSAGSHGMNAQMTYTHGGGWGILEQSYNVQPGIDFAYIRGQYVTFAITVQSTVAGTVRLGIADNQGITYGPYNVGTGAEVLSVAKQMDGVSSAVQFRIACDVQSCVAQYNDGMVAITGGVQMAVQAPVMLPATELNECLRYYERVGGVTNCILGFGCALSATAADIIVPFTPKGGSPTITMSAPGNYALRVQGGNNTCTAVPTFFPSARSALVNPSIGGGMVAGSGCSLTALTTAGWLGAEWNP